MLGAILLLALIARIPLLNGSFWLDEAAQALESIRPFSQQLDIIADFQPPQMHYLLHFAQYASHSEWWLRTISALIPGLLSTFAVTKITKNKAAGVLAAALLATSSLHIFYSQELRPYMLPTLWATLSTAALFQLWHTKITKTSQIIGLSLLNWLGLTSMYVYPFFMIGQLLTTALLRAKSLKSVFVAHCISAVLFLPLLPLFLKQLAAGQLVRSDLPGWEEVVSITQLKVLPLIGLKFIYGVVDVEPSLGFIASVALIAVLCCSLLIKASGHMHKKPCRDVVMLASLVIITLLSGWIISFWIPVLRPKRVLYLLPLVYLSLSLLIATNWKAAAAQALTILLLGVNLFGTISYYTQPQLQREDWRSLHTEITHHYPAENSTMLFSFPGPFAPWRWYDNGSYPTISTGKLAIATQNDLTAVTTKLRTTQPENVLVPDYLRDLTDPKRELDAVLNSEGWFESDVIDRPNIGFTRVFQKQPNSENEVR